IERAGDLSTLDRPLGWWTAADAGGAIDDLRDAFARRVPLAPLPSEASLPIRGWFRRSSVRDAPGLDLDLAPDDRLRGPSRPPSAPGGFPHLSEAGRARWLCLEALTVASRPKLSVTARWQSIASWRDAR